MRLSLWLVALTFSTTIFACPEVNDTFVCENETLAISHRVEGGVNIYRFDNGDQAYDAYADGRVHRLPNDDTMRDSTFRLECRSSRAIDMIMEGTLLDNGAPLGSFALNQNYSRDENGDLVIVTTGEILGQPIDQQTETCVRQ